MRSRYCAFAKANAPYLWRTLHARHPDRERPEKQVLRELLQGAETRRYLGLTILATDGPNAEGVARVMFHAKVFQKGRDLSFAECSEFLHDGTGWRYVGGRAKATRAPSDLEGVTIDDFLGSLSENDAGG